MLIGFVGLNGDCERVEVDMPEVPAVNTWIMTEHNRHWVSRVEHVLSGNKYLLTTVYLVVEFGEGGR